MEKSKLSEYSAKRKFEATPEPAPAVAPAVAALSSQETPAAAAIEPLDPTSHGVLASFLQDRGDFQGAIRDYEIVLLANSNPAMQAHIYASLGVIYRQLGEYAKAREDSERALHLDSNSVLDTIQQTSEIVAAHPDAPGYFQLGLLREGAGQIAEAQSAYQQALRLNPDFGPARKALEALGEGKQ